VLTHGEPHAGNTIRTKDGWRMVDWDTTRLAPPERDLCLLDDQVDAYAAATGVAARADLLELFRLRWRLADVAIETHRFRRPHTGDADDDRAAAILRDTLADLTG
jgi:spectinomycin phosphotransferase/16S rRNA (guanine(1405)-N(7))-methyltransferase